MQKYLSNSEPGHTTGGSGTHGAGRTWGPVDAGQNKLSTFRWLWRPIAPLAFQHSVNKCFESLFASTKKENPMCTVKGTKSPFDPQIITGLYAFVSPGRQAFFVASYSPEYRHLLVFENPFHARHVWKVVEVIAVDLGAGASGRVGVRRRREQHAEEEC